VKFVEKKIKVKDKELKELFRREQAARLGLQIMAENAAEYNKRAWELAEKLHALDILKQHYCYDSKAETIKWKEFEDMEVKK
jgi:hypothetical protein